MQADLYAKAKITDHISLFLMGGFRKAQFNHENATRVWSREHYVMWKQHPDDNYGLYVRVGRFMPVFGLRFAEHTMYTRRFGGTQLYADTYGAAVEKIAEKYELHVSAFVEDPLIDPVERANGAAVYGEYRLNEKVALGLEGMYKNFSNGNFLLSKDFNSEYQEFRIGVTNKVYLEAPDVVLSTEIQFVNGLVGKDPRSPDSQVGGAPKGLVGGVVVIGLYVLVLIYGLSIALRCRHQFGRLLAMGITSAFFMSMFINVAMVMGMLPVVGMPLPLVSYGGSAMLTILVGFGLVISAHVHRDIRIPRRTTILDT